MKKNCRQCRKEFEITDDDSAFYKKISPTFGGETFEIPAPTLCPDCRRQRRLAWRNMSKIYQRKCDLTGETIISAYPPNSKFKIYKRDYWVSDKWDPYEYGRGFDFSRPFFKQLQELHFAVPKMHLNVDKMENSEFANNASGCKNCYLIQNSTDAENCLYSLGLFYSKDCVDCYKAFESQYCYECTNIEKCYGCLFCSDCVNCTESILSDNCTGCKNCFGCSNLNNKQYWINNHQSSKDEFEKIRDSFLKENIAEREKTISKSAAFSREQPKKFAHSVSVENSNGDYLHHCKNISKSFIVDNSENIKYSTNLGYAKDMWDTDFWGDHAAMSLEMTEVGQTRNILYSRIVYGNCADIYYSLSVMNGSHDCFGCAGLRHAQYCILNKRYSKDEYEQLTAKIIKHMQKTGEWGEFFPIGMSDFAYNETSAIDHFPITKSEVLKLGGYWQDDNFDQKHEGEEFVPEGINVYRDPDKADKLLKSILVCSRSGRPFRVQPQELAFYLKHQIQVPIYHPDERSKSRFQQINPQKTWHRQCMNKGCENKFETTYAPDRPEKVYCESCYQKSVI